MGQTVQWKEVEEDKRTEQEAMGSDASKDVLVYERGARLGWG
jgi:hypothetical protein